MVLAVSTDLVEPKVEPKVAFLISGVGVISDNFDFAFLRQQSPLWQSFIPHLQDAEPTVRHALQTVATHVTLCDIWSTWGVKPSVVVAHSLGEVSAAYLTGMLTLEETIDITIRLAQATAGNDGWMAHGFDLKPTLGTHVVSHNFVDAGRSHTTVAGASSTWEAFAAVNREAKRMHISVPWHLPGTPGLRTSANGDVKVRVNTSDIALFTSLKGGLSSQLHPGDWDTWLASPMRIGDAFAAAAAAHSHEELACIEIGMHPVMREMAACLRISFYLPSGVRGQPLGPTLAESRALVLGPAFDALVLAAAEGLAPGTEPSRPLLAQGFTSSMMTALASRLARLFPSIKPHDLYHHGSLKALTSGFGRTASSTQMSASRLASSSSENDPVVIVGASCCLPGGARDMVSAWEFLQQGRDGVVIDKSKGELPCGYVDLPCFDHEFFGISEAEASAMDPQQVLALQLTESLLVDSQLGSKALWGSKTGVYMGAWNTDYAGVKDSAYRVTGSNPSVIPARISRQYNLKGPSRQVNTACSSSLEAILDGLRDVQSGRVDYAIAGGVNMLWNAEFTEAMRAGGFLSATGRCRTFSADADGYARAEGGGMVLLAKRSMVDSFRAVLRGGASNHNGYLPLITVPSSEAQEMLIRDACSDAGISLAQLDYVECHGTGTKIGDPIELSGLANLMRAEQRDSSCVLGSAKANFGHLESAAGVVGVIKTILVLTEQQVPPTPHLKKLNENLDLCDGKLRIEPNGGAVDVKFAGISSFGFGGSNAHVILERSEAPRSTNSGYRAPADGNCKGIQLVRVVQTESADDALDSAATVPIGRAQADRASVQSSLLVSLRRMDIDPEKQMTTPLIDLGLDSLAMVDLVMQVRKSFGVELDLARLVGGVYSADSLITEISTLAILAPQNCDAPGEAVSATLAFKPPVRSQKQNIKDLDEDLHCTRMLKSEKRIKTTHVGSLPRVDGDTGSRAVHRQLDAGIDLVNDGECSRASYAAEMLESMTGFEDNRCTAPMPRDLLECPECSRRFMGRTSLITLNPQLPTRSPACVGEVTYTKKQALNARLDEFVASLHANGLKVEDGFYTCPSPGVLLCFFENQFYKNDETYLAALAQSLAVEYEEIASRGLSLQIDCPDLAMGRHLKYQGVSERVFLDAMRMHVKFLNEALRNVPSRQCRLHLCWGNYSAPHHRDVSLEVLISILNEAKPRTLLIEGANVRHHHEYRYLAALSEDKIVVPGVIDSSSQHVEHPEVVANRICCVAQVVGAHRMLASPDCGFSTTAQSSSVPSQVAWMKMRSLVEGAALASRALFPSPSKTPFKPRALVRCYLFGDAAPDVLDARAEYRAVPSGVTDVQRLARHMKQFVDIPAVFCAEQPAAQELAKAVAAALKGTAAYPSAIWKKDGFARSGAAAIDAVDGVIGFTFDRERLKLPVVPPRRDCEHNVLVIGAGLTGLHMAHQLTQRGLDVAVLEKSHRIAGIWDVFANDTSQVNTSEAAYRLNTEDRSKANKDHSTTREVLEDALTIAERLDGRIHLGITVVRVERTSAKEETPRYAVTLKDGTVLRAGGVVMAINDRVGVPRSLTWPGQESFLGQLVDGFGNDAVKQNIDWVGKEVVVLGMGAFAVENVRTALERGACHVTVISRRHGTVCPKYIDYINFVNKDGADVSQDSVANTQNMMVWRQLYERSGATMPECWMGNIKHYGHTISVSDHWWVGHHLGLLETLADEIDHFEHSGLVMQSGCFVSADIVVRCTGFERNACLVPALSPYTHTNSINYLDEDVMYLADALLDDEVFNSMFGSSVLEMAKFFCSVYAYFWENKSEYRALVQDGAFHQVAITERKWSDYIAGSDVLRRRVPAIAEAASKQVRTRRDCFLAAHDVEEFKRENKREWEALHEHLAVWAPGVPQLPYPEW